MARRTEHWMLPQCSKRSLTIMVTVLSSLELGYAAYFAWARYSKAIDEWLLTRLPVSLMLAAVAVGLWRMAKWAYVMTMGLLLLAIVLVPFVAFPAFFRSAAQAPPSIVGRVVGATIVEVALLGTVVYLSKHRTEFGIVDRRDGAGRQRSPQSDRDGDGE